ncbi:hypothetical protein OQX63_17965 [Pedobacter sp. PF22-3]|uniref:hypothetical protein n=1 Tax=Pedobacter sp. PF22-3 TaxID=2994467 RepID=UPI00224508BA|nr:hypothetical protein [Pedobacter sp. PF22-3]MCX2495382.1 hypothetical protein [Pedobacter sp. PF22-3]
MADSPGEKIPQKMFHGEIQNDHDAIATEEAGYKLLPVLRTVTKEDIDENYLRVKRDVQELMRLELKKISNRQPKKLNKRKNRDSVIAQGKAKKMAKTVKEPKINSL